MRSSRYIGIYSARFHVYGTVVIKSKNRCGRSVYHRDIYVHHRANPKPKRPAEEK